MPAKSKKAAVKKTKTMKGASAKKAKTPKKKSTVKKSAVKKGGVKKTMARKKPSTKKTSIKKAPPSKKTKLTKTSRLVKKAKTPQVKPTKKAPVAKKPNLQVVASRPKPPKQPEIMRPLKPSTAGLYGVPPYVEKPGEAYMNEDHKAHFREILYRWKHDLMEEVDRTKSHMQDVVSRYPDPSDSATQEEEFSLELRTRDRERKLIKKIDEALERIDNDEYGYCDACGVEIGIRRLEARPTAEMCVDCKTMDEIKEKQTRA